MRIGYLESYWWIRKKRYVVARAVSDNTSKTCADRITIAAANHVQYCAHVVVTIPSKNPAEARALVVLWRLLLMVSAKLKILQHNRVTYMVSLLGHIRLRCFQSHHKAAKKTDVREHLAPSCNQSVTEFEKKKGWDEKPVLCHILMEKLQSRTQWRNDSSWSPHLEQIVEFTMFLYFFMDF